jgi:hypothetical protein
MRERFLFWLGWLLMAPFIIGPIVELGLHLSDGTWHQNAFWVFLLSAMGWLWVWWVVCMSSEHFGQLAWQFKRVRSSCD